MARPNQSVLFMGLANGLHAMLDKMDFWLRHRVLAALRPQSPVK